MAPHGASGDQILVRLPGVTDVDAAKAVIRSTGRLEVALIEAGPAPTAEQLIQPGRGAVPTDMQVVTGRDESLETDARSTAYYYVVQRVAPVTGRGVRHARATVDEFNRPAITFSLDQDGADAFDAFTSDAVWPSSLTATSSQSR